MVYSLFFLSAITAGVLAIIATIRIILFYQREKYDWAKSKFWLGLFIILFILFGVYSWQSWYSVLPIIGFILGTVSYWVINPRHIRILVLLTQIPWFFYAVIIGSYSLFLNESFVLISVLVGIYRFDIRKTVP